MKTRFVHGNTQWNNTYVGLDGEITVDLEKKALRVHDGVTPGGFEAVGIKAYDPGTGPGPKELSAGTVAHGFYGEVSSEEFISYTDLALEVGLSAGTPLTDAGWLKFADGDKVLFVAKRPIRYRITMQDLKTRNVVDGSTEITIGEGRYRVRLMTGLNDNPSVTDSG